MQSRDELFGTHGHVTEAASLRAADAATADSSPSFPSLVSRVFAAAGIRLRIRLLRSLLQRVGPLAIATLAAGAFFKCLERAGWSGVIVTVEDALHTTSSQVLELARYVEQSDPQRVEQIYRMLAASPTALAVVGSSVLALAMRSRRRRVLHGRTSAPGDPTPAGEAGTAS